MQISSVYQSFGNTGIENQPPLSHPQLRRGPRSARKIQLNLRIPPRMSSVGSPATDSRSSRHDFCCNRNTNVQPIQIEEKALSINLFIFQRKERYLRPRVIVVSVTMPPSAGMATSSADAEEEEKILGVPFVPPPPPPPPLLSSSPSCAPSSDPSTDS